MNNRKLNIIGERCNYCRHFAPLHHKACPKTPEDVELWQAGYDAASDGHECYAEKDGTYWLGWIIHEVMRGFDDQHP